MLQRDFTPEESTMYVNLIDILCNDSGCLTYLGDDKRYGLTSWDSGHLTPVASDYVAEKLLVNLIIDR